LNNHLKLFDLNTYKVNQNIQEILSKIFNNIFQKWTKTNEVNDFISRIFLYLPKNCQLVGISAFINLPLYFHSSVLKEAERLLNELIR